MKSSKLYGAAVCAVLALGMLTTVRAGEPKSDGKAAAACTCADVHKTGMGFCDKCGHGEAYGIKIPTRDLYTALAGTTVNEKDMGSVKCPGCQAAMKNNGVCDHCHVAFFNNMEYHSMPAHTLAKGMPLTDAKVKAGVEKCPACKAAAEKGEGYCDKCKAGIVAGRVYQGKDNYDAAVKADEIITKAAAAKCPPCGVAIATDGECGHCHVKYKNGEMVKM